LCFAGVVGLGNIPDRGFCAPVLEVRMLIAEFFVCVYVAEDVIEEVF
jgi:hypothetical protein